MIKPLSMEATHILTWVAILVIGIGLGLLASRIFEKENEGDDRK